MVKLLYVGMYYDYGRPWQGLSHEEVNFHASLREYPGIKLTHFDFMENARIHGKEKMNDMLLSLVAENEFDALFYVPFTDEILESTIEKITSTNITTIAWGCDDHVRFEQYSSHWAPYFNFWVTTASDAIPKFLAMGYTSIIKSQWACAPSAYPNLNIQKDLPVTFVGMPHGNRSEILSSVHSIGIPVHVFGLGWNERSRITHEQMIEIFNRSKINLNLSNASGMQCSQIKGRIFEVPCCGGFLLTDDADNLGDYFESGKELVLYDSVPDMIEKIKYYLAHEDEREEIAQAGYIRALREHTWKNRFDHIFTEAKLI